MGVDDSYRLCASSSTPTAERTLAIAEPLHRVAIGQVPRECWGPGNTGDGLRPDNRRRPPHIRLGDACEWPREAVSVTPAATTAPHVAPCPIVQRIDWWPAVVRYSLLECVGRTAPGEAAVAPRTRAAVQRGSACDGHRLRTAVGARHPAHGGRGFVPALTRRNMSGCGRATVGACGLKRGRCRQRRRHRRPRARRMDPRHRARPARQTHGHTRSPLPTPPPPPPLCMWWVGRCVDVA